MAFLPLRNHKYPWTSHFFFLIHYFLYYAVPGPSYLPASNRGNKSTGSRLTSLLRMPLMPLPHGERLYSRQKLDVMTHYLISRVVKFVFEPKPHVSKTFELSVIDESIDGISPPSSWLSSASIFNGKLFCLSQAFCQRAP